GEAFMARQELPVEVTEQRREALTCQLVRLGDCEQFHKKSGKLHKLIVGAPGVAVACPDHEPHAAIEVGRGVEVAHGMNDVVETAGHGHDRLVELWRGLLEDL